MPCLDLYFYIKYANNNNNNSTHNIHVYWLTLHVNALLAAMTAGWFSSSYMSW